MAECCKVISAYATRRGIGLRKLVNEFPALGSVKTFSDMKAGKFDGYDFEKQLPNYQAVARHVAEGAGSEERYALPAVEAIENALKAVMRSWGLDRVIFVDGYSGTGKTTAARMLCAKYGSRLMMVEATSVWDDSVGALLRAMLRALGVQTAPVSKVDALDKLLDLLAVTRKCVIIDEAHHLGPNCMNTIKTLVNQSPGEFCLIRTEEGVSKFNKQAYAEARQLSTNRMSERVEVVLDDRAVAAYVKGVFPDAPAADLKEAVRVIRPPATRYGNMAFVRDVCREVEELTLDAVIEAVQKVASRK